MSRVLATSRPRTPPRLTTRWTSLTAASMGALGCRPDRRSAPGASRRSRPASRCRSGSSPPPPRDRSCACWTRGCRRAPRPGRRAIMILKSQLRIAQAPDAALAILVEPGGGHAVGAVDLAGNVLATGRAMPLARPKVPPFLFTHWALGPLRHIGHAVAHGRPSAAGEEIRAAASRGRGGNRRKSGRSASVPPGPWLWNRRPVEWRGATARVPA